jgi:hypothetical protein
MSGSGCGERPDMADSCLSHCNIVLQRSESAEKAANGKNRPLCVIRPEYLNGSFQEKRAIEY